MSGTYSNNEARLDSAAREIQAQFEPAYAANGTRAPQRVFGESASEYRQRLLRPLLPHSKKWNGFDLKQAEAARILHVVEQEVMADARKAATANTGPLRAIESRSRAGHLVVDRYGDAASCWNQFKRPTQFVKAWRDPRTGKSEPAFPDFVLERAR